MMGDIFKRVFNIDAKDLSIMDIDKLANVKTDSDTSKDINQMSNKDIENELNKYLK